MPFIFTYLLKLSLSLGVVFLFYHFVLRKLTFYNWNRWYLLGYTLLSFFIPFINISLVLQRQQWTDNGFIQWVPVIDARPATGTTGVSGASASSFTLWTVLAVVFIGGALFILTRLLVQLISFRRMMKQSELISANNMKIYQVNDSIIPFSFGNSIFINRNLHTDDELQEIIRHEFVHVRQRHSIDIIWGELLCLVNWYNPFAWLLKRSIRQNLEFVADNKVLEYGIDKKQYQYLLLKVIGNSQFSIANQFNFSSLKKRIAMMNKMKSPKRQLLRWIFLLPATAILLVAFRNKWNNPADSENRNKKAMEVVKGFQPSTLQGMDRETTYTDTVPPVKKLNGKGYYIDIVDASGNCTIVVKDKNRKEVTRLLLTEWNEKGEYYENLYGEIPPPPPAPPNPPVPPTPPVPPAEDELTKTFLRRNSEVKSIGWVFNNTTDNMVVLAHIMKKDGTVEKYDLSDKADLAKAEKKYGQLPMPPSAVPPIAPIAPVAPIEGIGRNLGNISDDFEITDKKAEIRLKDGSREEYDLTNADERRKFEKKYGKIIALPVNGVGTVSPVAIVKGMGSQTVIAPSVNGVGTISPVAIVSGMGSQTVIAPLSPLAASGLTVIDPNGYVITGTEDVLITITKNTSRQQLEEYKKQMKDKGIELSFDEIEYNEKGKLIAISGRMKSKDAQSNFSASDFSTLILAMIKDGDRTYFKVSTKDKQVI